MNRERVYIWINKLQAKSEIENSEVRSEGCHLRLTRKNKTITKGTLELIFETQEVHKDLGSISKQRSHKKDSTMLSSDWSVCGQ